MDAAAPARDAGTDGGVTAVSATGGCSCRTGATAPDERAPALLAVFAALALRRRNAPHIVRKR
jgi:MYXO-CTERM domain-containing protein